MDIAFGRNYFRDGARVPGKKVMTITLCLAYNTNEPAEKSPQTACLKKKKKNNIIPIDFDLLFYIFLADLNVLCVMKIIIFIKMDFV